MGGSLSCHTIESRLEPVSCRRRRRRQYCWRDLLTARGADLWTVRRQDGSHDRTGADDRTADTDNRGCRYFRVDHEHRRHRNVCVLTQASLFLEEERQGRLCKSPRGMMLASRTAANSHHTTTVSADRTAGVALTNATGTEWIRQRRIVVQDVLGTGVKEQSLTAAALVSFDENDNDVSQDDDDDGNNHNNEVSFQLDLKKYIQRKVLQWVVYLFQGRDDAALSNAFFSFWKEIRRREKQPDNIATARRAFGDCIRWDAGLFKAFQQSELSSEDTKANCMNAMVAAFETTFSVVFWTLLNLASRRDMWNKCRNEVDEKDDHSKLAAFKKMATEGASIALTEMSVLDRCLVETIRVYPPVWTLPRMWSHATDEGSMLIPTKFDVPSANEALHRNWDPERASPVKVFSFGIGKRSCPGGTAALFAARVMLRKFMETFATLQESRPDHALTSAYLGPTLCLEGRQYFNVTRQSP